MKRRLAALTAAIIGCLLLIGLAHLALDATPVDASVNMQGLAVPAAPASATAQPAPDKAAAVATNIAEHQAFEATLEARQRAGAANAAPADPHNRPTVPASCPRRLPAQSEIHLPNQQDPSARQVLVSTQAEVVVGSDDYALSSGALRDNALQGVIVVTHFASNPCAAGSAPTTVTQYTMPAGHGMITLTAVHGESVDFTTSDGTVGHFNLVTKQFN